MAKNPGLWRLVFEKIPFFALAAAASVVTFMVSKRAGVVAAGESLPFAARGANALVSYCRYLGKLFWPTDLAIFYPHPGHWPMTKVLLAGGLMLGISVLLVVKRRRYPFLLMGWLWYCGMLVPAIGLVQVGAFSMADRYTYLPSLGVLLLAVWGACELTRGWRRHGITLSVAGSAAIILCMAVTRQQLVYWQDSETLSSHALEVTENNFPARYSLGAAFFMKGQIDEAIRQFQEVIRFTPDDVQTRNDLGAALGRKGEIDEAIIQFQEAIRLKPDGAESHINLGTALLNKGKIDEAIFQFQEAVRVKPDDAGAHNNLGTALLNNGQIDEAIRQLQETIRLKPGDAGVRNKLGAALGMKGRTDEAIIQFREALRLKPDDANARNNLGIALGKKGQTN